MKKHYSPFSTLIFITTVGEIQQQEGDPSFLLKDYDLSIMLSFFKNNVSEKISLDSLEESFQKPQTALESDTAKMNTILGTKEDFDEKIRKLISLYGKIHYYSKDSLVILIAKLLFANEQWFIGHKEEAEKLFPNQKFDAQFFDHRRSSLCVHTEK